MYTSCTQMRALHLRTQTTQRGPWLSMHHHDPHERPSGSTPPLVGMPAACPIRSVTHVHAHIISTRHSRMHLDGARNFKDRSIQDEFEALAMPRSSLAAQTATLAVTAASRTVSPSITARLPAPTAPVNYARAALFVLCGSWEGRQTARPTFLPARSLLHHFTITASAIVEVRYHAVPVAVPARPALTHPISSRAHLGWVWRSIRH